ncbi:hypothetical protein M7I_2824 [Glarea lozoyensis 74030]|uniref:Uncharacterized protein n=1 Tax=Glarea lozoyensis (strain ATCC 74030 / MF5533) TaxID=1104152 RepID=H0EJU2_GLAL7|nr:hypothetical protein M7I_2824 [Glarea lozoyensis 74030]
MSFDLTWSVTSGVWLTTMVIFLGFEWECCLSSLELDTLRWQKLAEGREIFKPGYRWHYCTMNEEGTKAWLLGCPTDPTATDLGPGGFEEYLRCAANFCLLHWGRVVRTQGFLRLPRTALVELSQEIDMEGRVVGGEELEYVGGLGGARFGFGGATRKASISSNQTQHLGSETDENEEMEIVDLKIACYRIISTRWSPRAILLHDA